MLSNLTKNDEDHNLSPWDRRHRGRYGFNGQLVFFGAKIHYLPTAGRELEQRQKAAPRMVEGLFAGYKVLHDARWNGEYLVYDRVAYKNWNGKLDLPVHTTKELYVPGDAADSRDLPGFQFPVRNGDWKSQAPYFN